MSFKQRSDTLNPLFSSHILPTKLCFKTTPVCHQRREEEEEERDQLEEVMAETRSSRSRELDTDIEIRSEQMKEKENFLSLGEDVINIDKTTSRIKLKRRRCRLKKSESNLSYEVYESIKRYKKLSGNENKNDHINNELKQVYICQLSPSLLFAHQANTVKVCQPSLNQAISDSQVITKEDSSVSSCYCLDYRCLLENKMEPLGLPEKLLNFELNQEEEEEEEVKAEVRLDDRSLRRNTKQDCNSKFISTKVPKFISPLNVLILFSIILFVSKQNTQRCDIGRCKSAFIMEAVGK